jgi:hypothetical protein
MKKLSQMSSEEAEMVTVKRALRKTESQMAAGVDRGTGYNSLFHHTKIDNHVS